MLRPRRGPRLNLMGVGRQWEGAQSTGPARSHLSLSSLRRARPASARPHGSHPLFMKRLGARIMHHVRA